MRAIDRRRFLKGVGAAGAMAWASPWLSRLGWASHGGLDAHPFEYGVASGDPAPDRVVLWTRYTGKRSSLGLHISTDPDFGRRFTRRHGVDLDPGADGTVVVDVDGLDPATRYWYRFVEGENESAHGRTKTAPDPDADISKLRFAVTSCQDFRAGYYHAWRDIAAQDLDFVLFLGDYIYEGADDGDEFRPHDPHHEILTLDDYRRRYRNYRSDFHLREAHRLHPFITVWDDHEVANDRWGVPSSDDPADRCGGAQAHDSETEGDYCDRLAAATQAFFEYSPLRRPDPDGDPNRIYRTLRFGSLADLFALDTRSYRHEPKGAFFNPVTNSTEPAIGDPDRTMLGAEQKAEFKDWLGTGGPQWRLVGNQVMFGHLNFASFPDPVAQALAELVGVPHRDGVPVNHDQWDGYQPERRELLEHLRDAREGDVVFLTGDIHTSWVHELTVNPAHAPAEEPVGVEFVGPSISSSNLNELVGSLTIGRPMPHRSSVPFEAAAMAGNRHLRYVELDSNGYVLVEVTPERALAEYRHVVGPLLTTQQPVEHPGSTVETPVNGRWKADAGSARVTPALPG